MKGDFVMQEEKMVWETPKLKELTLNKTESGAFSFAMEDALYSTPS